MNIELRKDKIEFGELKKGDVFEFNHSVFIKIEELTLQSAFIRNAVFLTNGDSCNFADADKVEYKGSFFKVGDKKENE